jgi:hypothetical protein
MRRRQGSATLGTSPRLEGLAMSRSRRTAGRRLIAAAMVAAALTPATAAIAPTPASADGTDVEGSITLTLSCNIYTGLPGQIAMTEDFSNLQDNAGYQLKMTDSADPGSLYEDTTSYWIPDDNGDQLGTTYNHTVTIYPDAGVKSGDQFNWTLYKYYGVTSVALTGSADLGGPACSGSKPPAKPTFGKSPSSVTVTKKGRFTYKWSTQSDVTSKLTVLSAGDILTTAKAITTTSGTHRITMTVKPKAFKHLKKVNHEKGTVLVAVTSPSGTATGHHALRLNAPKPPKKK